MGEIFFNQFFYQYQSPVGSANPSVWCLDFSPQDKWKCQLGSHKSLQNLLIYEAVFKNMSLKAVNPAVAPERKPEGSHSPAQTKPNHHTDRQSHRHGSKLGFKSGKYFFSSLWASGPASNSLQQKSACMFTECCQKLVVCVIFSHWLPWRSLN